MKTPDSVILRPKQNCNENRNVTNFQYVSVADQFSSFLTKKNHPILFSTLKSQHLACFFQFTGRA